jgi:aryl-alcohol dehydrogenase-like predicted oxidoreductase
VLPIPGASKVASITNSLTAAAVTLDAADLAALDALRAKRR